MCVPSTFKNHTTLRCTHHAAAQMAIASRTWTVGVISCVVLFFYLSTRSEEVHFHIAKLNKFDDISVRKTHHDAIFCHTCRSASMI